jgi:RNA polymerase sigma-70 factor (ECF subfamily)
MAMAMPTKDSIAPIARADSARLSAIFSAQYDFIWRSLRRLGIPEAAADDAAQEVFLVASRKLDRIEPGRERSFLYGTALRVASDTRRALARHEGVHAPPQMLEELCSPLDPAELTDQKRARELLDKMLLQMPVEIRSVFALFELEGLTMIEIAECVGIPMGTVASRLRRGREKFQQLVGRLQAQIARTEGKP